MGSRDKDGLPAEGTCDLVPDATATETSRDQINEDTVNNETVAVDNDNDNDIWATTQGYTPLADLHGGAALFHVGPGASDNDNDNNDEEPIFASHAGAFFADMSAFGPSNDNNNNDDNNNDDNNNDDNDNNNTDFRQIAGQALSSLEDDYRMTVQGENQKSALELVAAPPVLLTSDDDAKFAKALFDTSRPNDAPAESSSTNPVILPTKDLPDIDAEAVRRAVQAINLRDPVLTNNFSSWEQAQKQASAVAPRLHAIIPQTSLSAFRKRTNKAVNATANLTRAACIAEALHRLDLLKSQDTLCIHVIGCDHVECQSVERTRHYFGFLARWIAAHAESPRHLQLCLVGPNVPAAAAALEPIDLLATPTGRSKHSRLETAVVTSHVGLYNEWMVEQSRPVDLAIAFNAGVWGYDTWAPTFEFLAGRQQSIPFVVTAYTIQEAQDDFDVVQDIVAASVLASAGQAATDFLLWKPQVNVLASKRIRETVTAVAGREYRENGAWQAWRL